MAFIKLSWVSLVRKSRVLNMAYNVKGDSKKALPRSNDVEAAEHFITHFDQGYKGLGTLSSIGLICNRMLGTGIFVVSANIYKLSGSVGMTLLLWVVGALIAMTGLYVYMEFGTAIPRNGGEKNYLEFVFKKPTFFITSMYAAYVFFIGWAAGNSVVAARMLLIAAGMSNPTRWSERSLGIFVVFFCFLLNLNIKLGLYFQNGLGVIKIFIVLFISIIGLVALCGGLNIEPTGNFRNLFEGSGDVSVYGIINAIYSVIWSFVGYSNINYALGEVKNPVATLRKSGPISLIILTILYLFVNIAYFSVISKDSIKNLKLDISIEFFRIVFGEKARKAGAVFIALSALGNVSSVIFSQARIIQQLGREGVLPFSSFFATSKPFNSPAVALAQHFLICAITIIAPPPGDAYNLVLNLISYPMNIINVAISGGLLWIYYKRRQGVIEWNPPIKAGVILTSLFFLANVYLVVVPYIPPKTKDQSVYDSLPYYIHCLVTWGIFFVGAVYWFFWSRLLPKLRGYNLVHSEVLGDDGFWKNKIVKQYIDPLRVESSSDLEYSKEVKKERIA